jgi:hypothetical protein
LRTLRALHNFFQHFGPAVRQGFRELDDSRLWVQLRHKIARAPVNDAITKCSQAHDGDVDDLELRADVNFKYCGQNCHTVDVETPENVHFHVMLAQQLPR